MSISAALIIVTNPTSEGIHISNIYDMTLGINICSLMGTMFALAVFLDCKNTSDIYIIQVKNYEDMTS